MNILQFQLFRIRVFISEQTELFESRRLTPSLAIDRVIRTRPSAELRLGYEWHVGNIDAIDHRSIYFALGRITKSTIPLFDKEARDFMEVEFEQAPYTHAVLDFPLELVGIAANSRLSPTSSGIARQLTRLMNRSAEEMNLAATFEIAALSDPEEFISRLMRAAVVTRFLVTFSRPNAFDANADFQQPMERLLAEARGEAGHTVLRGKQLQRPVLEKLARSVAATGNDARASYRAVEGGPIRRSSLREQSVVVGHPEPIESEARRSLMDSVRQLYQRIRERK